MLLTTARWGFALVILCMIGWPKLVADWPAVRRNAAYLMALGGVGFTIFNIALYSAVIYTTAINVSIEQAGIPMLIFLANFLLFRLRVTWAQILGFAFRSPASRSPPAMATRRGCLRSTSISATRS